jgi:hypothetical protein
MSFGGPFPLIYRKRPLQRPALAASFFRRVEPGHFGRARVSFPIQNRERGAGGREGNLVPKKPASM